MVLQTIPEFRLPGNNEQTAFLDRRSVIETCLEQDVYAFAWTLEDIAPHPHGHPSDVPGAYRYDPADHDPTIPETDPRSPRYEPPHLRHQPGDTWIIDRCRPSDPDDPGPYGSPGWYQDTRTGRHRRGERPDPLLDENRTTGKSKPGPRPSGERRWQAGRQEDTGPKLSTVAFDSAEPERFSSLREAAWGRFLTDSQVFHEAHYAQSESSRERLIGLMRNMLDMILRLLGIGRRGSESDRILAPGEPDEVQPWAMSGRPEQVRPVPNTPYIAQWERQFDAGNYFRNAVSA